MLLALNVEKFDSINVSVDLLNNQMKKSVLQYLLFLEILENLFYLKIYQIPGQLGMPVQ